MGTIYLLASATSSYSLLFFYQQSSPSRRRCRRRRAVYCLRCISVHVCDCVCVCVYTATRYNGTAANSFVGMAVGRGKLANRDFSSRREIHRREGTSREPRNDGATTTMATAAAMMRWRRQRRGIFPCVCLRAFKFSFDVPLEKRRRAADLFARFHNRDAVTIYFSSRARRDIKFTNGMRTLRYCDSLAARTFIARHTRPIPSILRNREIHKPSVLSDPRE